MMNTLVVYDSLYGNTEKIAKAIGSACGAKVLHASEVKPEHLEGLDALIVGSPTQAFQSSKPMKTFLSSIPQGALKGLKVASFDTRMDVVQVNNRLLTGLAKLFGYAAKPMAAILVGKGGRKPAYVEGFIVSDKEGPLKEGELERAVQWAKQIAE